jgi:hypothetical protein
MPTLSSRIVRGVAQEHRELRRAERVLDALHQRAAEASVTVGRDQSDGEAFLTQQALHQVVWAEAEFTGDLLDTISSFLAQLALAVECFRGRADTDPGGASDIADGRDTVWRGRRNVSHGQVGLFQKETMFPTWKR